MTEVVLVRLADILVEHREAIMETWRHKERHVPAARDLDTATLNDHIGSLLDDLAAALESGHVSEVVKQPLDRAAQIHGAQRLNVGFNLIELVAEYNLLRETILEFADAHGIVMSVEPNCIINRMLDNAIASAVQAYSEQKTLQIQQQREEHISFIVHDLKTPLAAITMATSVLEKLLPEESRTSHISQMLKITHRNAARLNALISKVLRDGANLQAGTGEFPINIEKRELDLWPLVEELIHDLNPLAEQNGTRMLNEVPDDCSVSADPVLLTQVIQNLLSNAIEYTANGEIRVRASLSEPDHIVWCSVQDTGEGIPQERIGKIFDKLETGPHKNGLGLGLAIVKQIVEAHGGQIKVASTPGAGSTFEFSLPNQ